MHKPHDANEHGVVFPTTQNLPIVTSHDPTEGLRKAKPVLIAMVLVFAVGMIVVHKDTNTTTPSSAQTD